MVPSPDFFDIVAQDMLVPYNLPKLYTTDVNRFNGFKLIKTSRQYPAETLTDAAHTDDLVLLIDTPVQAESLLHSQK